MPSSFNLNATAVNRLLLFLGSFWTSQFKEKTRMRMLVGLAVRTDLFGPFRNTVYNLMGLASENVETNVVLPFRPEDVHSFSLKT